MTDGDNPYQSPKALSESSQPIVNKRLSVLRGLAYAILFAPIGFLVPPVCFLFAAFAQWLLSGQSTESPVIMFSGDLGGMLSPSIGVSIVFAVSAFRNFSPAQQIGMIRSLIYVGGSLILGALAAALVTLVFGLENNSYDPDPWLWLKTMIALAFPVCYACNVVRKQTKVGEQRKLVTLNVCVASESGVANGGTHF